MKKCTVCGEKKEYSMFHKKRDGFDTRCKECQQEQDRVRRKAKKEYVKNLEDKVLYQAKLILELKEKLNK